MTNRRPKTKVCTGCQQRKKLEEFSPRKDGVLGRASRCRECRRGDWNSRADEINKKRREVFSGWSDARKCHWRKTTKTYREEHRTRLLEKARDRHREQREKVIQLYGGKCACCGEDRLEFLVIDHVNGGGGSERRQIGSNGVYRKLLREGQVLSDYRVLCYNCNCALAFCGYCPHNL